MSAAAWTALGTILLAAVTAIAVLTSQHNIRTERDRQDQRILETNERQDRYEQLSEAYAVQVVLGEDPQGGIAPQLAVMVVNHGHFAIKDIDARVSPDGNSLIDSHKRDRFGGFDRVDRRLNLGSGKSRNRER